MFANLIKDLSSDTDCNWFLHRVIDHSPNPMSTLRFSINSIICHNAESGIYLIMESLAPWLFFIYYL